MNTTYQINRESAPLEALATATAKALLTFAKSTTVDILLALVAVVQLMGWLISDGQAGNPAAWCMAWVLHFALMSAIDIHEKGGEL